MENESAFDTIESDPGVFTELIEALGCNSVQVDEILDLESAPSDALGMIFLFKYKSHPEPRHALTDYDPSLFYSKQVYSNACATQAILHVLMNSSEKVDLGKELNEFKMFTADFDAFLKGTAITNSEAIRTAHNSFSRQNSFLLESAPATDDDDVFHFVAYVPYHGMLYELDGLQAGPIALGECPNESHWTEQVAPIIRARTQSYTAELRFALMAVVPSRKGALQSRLDTLQQQRQYLAAIASSLELSLPALPSLPLSAEELPAAGDGADLSAVGEPSDRDAILATAQRIDSELIDAAIQLRQELDKRKSWHDENLRRKHNYVPFLIELLKQVAIKGRLPEATLRACAAAEEKAKRKQEKAAKEKESAAPAPAAPMAPTSTPSDPSKPAH
ncbi:putative Ubiquitin carboxyl-terminal hydrolase isozyme L5 [Paratrimastix pyriformis]|uniref:Ubiquitin carboxyl-terminal hydrolase n=1 Tax=Paratrimastix pyriformis TaxID=342808 RepID=A0ABQ8UQ16_9EUKA|nr:putative Ubiquitin carboxyl-terminal hydrolase isozyme L5 [Paratrimastix pyriformis]